MPNNNDDEAFNQAIKQFQEEQGSSDDEMVFQQGLKENTRAEAMRVLGKSVDQYTEEVASVREDISKVETKVTGVEKEITGIKKAHKDIRRSIPDVKDITERVGSLEVTYEEVKASIPKPVAVKKDTPQDIKKKLLEAGLSYDDLKDTPDFARLAAKVNSVQDPGIHINSGGELVTDVVFTGATVTNEGGRATVAISGSGDMLKATYDPTNVEGDAFAMENMVESATEKVMTDVERTKLSNITVTQTVDLDSLEVAVSALDSSVVLKGGWDASAGTFPGAGVAQAGWSYIVSVGGTVDGVVFAVNDRVIAILDNASTTVFASNWFKADYTDQVLSVAGKTGAVTLDKTDVGLTNVDNTSDADKPVSTDTQVELNLKADLAKQVNAQTGTSYTLVGLDIGKIVTMNNASANTLTVPNSVFAPGESVIVKMLGAGVTTIVAGSGMTLTDATQGDTYVMSATKPYRVILITGTGTADII